MTNSDLGLALRLADAADAVIAPYFRALPEVMNKAEAGFDPVTVADREAEAAMRTILLAERPDDAVLGEEYDATAGQSGRTWILDPIDGTRGFMAGLPTWGVLIALAEADGPVLGVMSQPFVRERFVAAPGEVAHHVRDGHSAPLRTRLCTRLADAVVATTHPAAFADPAPFERLAARCRMVRYGTDCYGYAMLAAGHIDVVVESGLKAVDIAPFVPIVEAAGGALVDARGARVGPTLPHDFEGTAVAVGDPSLVPAVLEALSS